MLDDEVVKVSGVLRCLLKYIWLAGVIYCGFCAWKSPFWKQREKEIAVIFQGHKLREKYLVEASLWTVSRQTSAALKQQFWLKSDFPCLVYTEEQSGMS